MLSGSGCASRMAVVADLAERPGRARLHRLLSGIRMDEVLVLQGTPLLGAAFSLGEPTLPAALSLLTFFAASCLLVAHVFVLNDWSEMSHGEAPPGRREGPGSATSLDRREARRLWSGLLAGSLALFSPLGWRTLAIAATIVLLSALYSAPPWRAKGIPLVNSALHLAGGVLHFLLGYSLFRRVDLPGVETALFFALTFVAGHLVQEVRDRDRDLLLGIRTNAAVFGKGPIFAAALVTFTLADLLLVGLAVQGVVPLALSLAAVLCPLQLSMAVRPLRDRLAPEAVRSFQWRYRALYAIFGAVIVATLCLRP